MRVRSLLVSLLLLAAVGCDAPSHREAAEASPFALGREHGHFVELGGIETFVVTLGAGPDVILIHGNPSSVYTWRHWLPKLAERHRVHALDLPGYGFSEKPADAPYTPSWMAGHVAAYMDAAGVESAVVVGNSMGGEIASEVAAIYPRRVRALVLIAPAGLPSDEVAARPLGYQLARVPGIATIASVFPMQPLIGATLKRAYFDPTRIRDEDVAAYAAPLETEGGLRAFIARGTRDETSDRSMLVRGIQAPTLIMLGAVDQISPLSIGRAYHALIAGSRLVTIASAGHLPQEERPEPSLAEMERWLATLGG